jgi:hypothetical protein
MESTVSWQYLKGKLRFSYSRIINSEYVKIWYLVDRRKIKEMNQFGIQYVHGSVTRKLPG